MAPLFHLQSQIDKNSLQNGGAGQVDANFNKSMSPLNLLNAQQLQIASNSASFFPIGPQGNAGQ